MPCLHIVLLIQSSCNALSLQSCTSLILEQPLPLPSDYVIGVLNVLLLYLGADDLSICLCSANIGPPSCCRCYAHICPANTYTCSNTGSCIPITSVCDQTVDCPQGNDEVRPESDASSSHSSWVSEKERVSSSSSSIMCESVYESQCYLPNCYLLQQFKQE